MNIGLLYSSDRMSGTEVVAYARRAEDCGVESLWLPEVMGRDPFSLAGYLLAKTERINVATGIANVYARDPAAMLSGATTLAEISGHRFMLGLGVSNPGINKTRGNAVWQPPVRKVRQYLAAMRELRLSCPAAEFPTYLAAHGPQLLKLAGALTDGAHTYLMNVEHTARARAMLGAGPALNPVMFCLVADDAEAARPLCRKAIAYYMGLDYYHRAWRDLGFSDADFAAGGSDRLIDSIVAWGDETTVCSRIAAQRAAGATRVIVIPLNTQAGAPDWDIVAALAKA